MDELLFEEIMIAAYEKEFSEYDNAPQHHFSLRHRRKMKKLFKEYGITYSEKSKINIKMSKRLLYVAVIIVTAVLLGITAIAVATGGFKFDSKPEYTMVLSEGWENAPDTLEYLYQLEVPDGFTRTEYIPDIGYSKFQRGVEYFIFTQSVKCDYNATYNTEGYEIEELMFDDNKAFFIQWEDVSVLACDNGDYILEICGTLSNADMQNLLKSAKIVK